MSESLPAPPPGYSIFDPSDPFETRAGPFYFRTEADGSHHFVLDVAERHCNSHGIVHGGLMMTMIDLVLVASAKSVPEDRFVTVSLNSEFIASAALGDRIEARGELIRRTRSLAFVRGQVTCGDATLLSSSAVLKQIRPKGAG